MIFELKGKSALVTGAGSGIGAAIAEDIRAAPGAHVFVTDLQIATATDTASRILAAGGSATLRWRSTSATKRPAPMSRARLARSTSSSTTPAIGCVGTALTTTGADLDRLYAVNVRGMFNVTKVVSSGYGRAASAGVIVNMASVAGLVGIQDRLAYSTTKFAVVGLTKSMALDHAADGHQDQLHLSRPRRDALGRGARQGISGSRAAYREMAATQAMGRMGTPEEIAAAALYLASDAASFVTGSAFAIDGGWKG